MRRRARILSCAAIVVVHLSVFPARAQDARESAENIPIEGSRAVVYAPGVGQSTNFPLHLAPGPHLFLDDYLIAASENVDRVVMPPKRDATIPNPIVTGDEDGCFQPYITVLRDPGTGRFRIWYGHRTQDFNTSRSHIGYMESPDGIQWERPARVLDDPAAIQFGVSVIDGGAVSPDPAKRYVYSWYLDSGLCIATSPDGLAWIPMTPEPVVRHNHDINGIFYDPLRARYVATISVYRTGDAFAGKRRITMQTHSNDLVHWSIPHHIILPHDGQDPGETQFYAMDGYRVCGDLIVGMVKVLRDDLKADDPPSPPDAYGMGYTALAWSRDGETWVRDRTHFFDPDPQPGTWDHAHAWIDDQVDVGEEVYLYYGGYARGHKVERFKERQIGLVAIKRDRYVARTAGATPGRITTPPLILEGNRLTINADASQGEILVQLLDSNGTPIAGFTTADATPIRADATSQRLTWERPITELARTPVQLQINLTNAKLYALGVE